MTTTARYEYDSTGTSANNLVSSEPQTLLNNTVRVCIPTYGSFYVDSMVVVDTATGKQLTSDQYYCAMRQSIPIKKSGKDVCAIVVVTDTTVSANVLLTYQAVGGYFMISATPILNMISNLNLDSRPATWGTIIGKPDTFNPAYHLHAITDVYGFEYVVNSIDWVTQAIAIGSASYYDAIYKYIDSASSTQATTNLSLQNQITAHVNNTSNPHNVTADQLGVYTSSAVDGLITTVKGLITAHTTNVSNPHNVTAAQLGVYVYADVDNKITALNTSLTTALTTHTSDTSNPHKVTAAQLSVYTISAMDTIVSTINSTISTHINNQQNPHNVTAAQLGVYTIAQITTLLAAKANSATTLAGYGITDSVLAATGAFTGPVTITDSTTTGTTTLALTAASNQNGATLKLTGNGSTTPSKTLAVKSGSFLIYANDGSTALMTLDNSGTVLFPGNVSGYSDRRLKDNFLPIDNALSKVKQLSGFTYDRVDIDTPRQMGLVAQDVLEVAPEVVREEKNGMLSVAYSGLIALLVEAVKTLSSEVDYLKTCLPQG